MKYHINGMEVFLGDRYIMDKRYLLKGLYLIQDGQIYFPGSTLFIRLK